MCRGNPEALKSLFCRYLPLIKGLRPYVPVTMLEDDDFYQEAIICLYKCTQRFHSGQGITFGIYYKKVLRNYYIDIMRQQVTLKRKANYNTQQLTTTDNEDGINNQVSLRAHKIYETPEHYTVIREEIAIFSAKLGPIDKRIFNLLLQGYQLESIASEMDLSVSNVRRRIASSRAKLRVQLYKEA